VRNFANENVQVGAQFEQLLRVAGGDLVPVGAVAPLDVLDQQLDRVLRVQAGVVVKITQDVPVEVVPWRNAPG
jgi:hypothetical protein